MIHFRLLQGLLCLKVFFGLLDGVVSNENLQFDEEQSFLQDDNSSTVEVIFLPNHLMNVHHKMTPDERLQTFGTHNVSVPAYTVFAVTVPKMRRKRQSNDLIIVNIKIKGKAIELNLKSIDNLATRYTPVWGAHSDSEAYNNIRYDPLPHVMRDIGEFQMYQDLEKEAALVFYKDPLNESLIIEGVVTPKYAIKTLPKRFSKVDTKNRFQYIVEPSMRYERSTDNDKDFFGYYVLVEVQSSPDVVQRIPQNNSSFKPREKRQSFKKNRREIPVKVYPEVLVVLDHNAIRNRSIVQTLRYTLAFWNSVNMVYGPLDEPKFHFYIAGIIISMDDSATPYISANSSVAVIENGSSILQKMGTYFYTENDRFSITDYDLIFAMTTIPICMEQLEYCEDVKGMSKMNGICAIKHYTNISSGINSVGIAHHNWMFAGVDVAVHETAHLFGVVHDDITADHGHCNGYVMAPSAELFRYNFQWSPCSIISFRHIFSNERFKCIDNKPEHPMETYDDRILSGRWLTIHGQCQNFGYEEACQLPGIPPCMLQGCKAIGSYKCEDSNFFPLPGSKCGENMHCDASEILCVSD